MKRILPFLLIGMVFWSSGCLWFSGKPAAVSRVEDPNSAMSVEILRPGLASKGGSVFFEPFKAGAEAEASAVLDHISEMIAKGAADAVELGGEKWSLASMGEAQFVFQGHIEKFQVPGKMKRMMPGRQRAMLSIRGELRVRSTGDVVALVYGWKKMPYTSQDIDRAAYDLGMSVVQGVVKQ